MPRLRLGFTRNAVHVVVRDEVVVPVPAPDILKKEAASDHPTVHVYLRVALRQLQLRQRLARRPV